MLEEINVLKEQLLDLIYPKICFSCKCRINTREDGYLCDDCLGKIIRINRPFCKICGSRIDVFNSDICPGCKGKKYYFSRGFTALLYEDLVKECIHNFKYNSHTYLGGTLADLMSEFAFKNIPLNEIDVIVPVPLFWRRFRDRGFNQSAILGKLLSGKTGIPYTDNALIRIKSSIPQVELPREERISNIEGVFKVSKQNFFIGKHILLIDDVFTTGATLNECSKALIENGAKDVWVFALARGISA